MSQTGISLVRDLLAQIDRDIGTCELKMLLFSHERGYCRNELRKQTRLKIERQKKQFLLENLLEEQDLALGRLERGYYLPGRDPFGVLPNMSANPFDVFPGCIFVPLPQWKIFKEVSYGSPDRKAVLARIGPKGEWVLESDF